MKLVCGIALLAVSCLYAQATVTFTIDALDLRTAGGATLMPISGQVFLVASTTDLIFGGPTADSFVSGDDVILYRGDLSGSGVAGHFQAQTPVITLSGNLNTGDPLQLYWFPTLTGSSTSPGAGTSYGFYRHDTGLDGSEPWVIQGDGFGRTLLFLTQSEGGTNPDALGWASFTVAPVPEASNLITAGLTLGLCALRLFHGRGRS